LFAYEIYLQLFAYEIWNKEKNKIDLIQKIGFNVLIIWESDYKQNKEETIQKCINFLSS